MEPCPLCVTGLAYCVERELDDCCFLRGSRGAKWQDADWQAKKQRYRWVCGGCADQIPARLIAELSPRLARAFWYPLAWCSALIWYCVDAESRWRDRRQPKD